MLGSVHPKAQTEEQDPWTDRGILSQSDYEEEEEEEEEEKKKKKKRRKKKKKRKRTS
jgi:hypothetical protein